ncbi:hypothetical protein NM208_g8064 [Fusarium decemcellulare]|uniref:Uncharacterized protein n=1 Tax=Fusarium decemcellulare TaxID=57161 RepID=A0ACC1S6U1_9HYPO|nr:hypothetical protein NM208_g8064 [Fusarium decemcellulare]
MCTRERGAPLLTGSAYNESILFAQLGAAAGSPLSAETRQALDNEFRCGARDSAVARRQRAVPTWRYIFANQDPLTNIGATHGDDVHQVFGDGSGLSDIFQDAWAAFARNPFSGLQKLGWPRYTCDGDTLVLIAPNKTVSVDFVSPDPYDEACPHVA